MTSAGATMSGAITGTAIDDKENPVEGAAIVVLALPDSTFVTGTITDLSGRFSLDIPDGSQDLLVRAEAIGYEKSSVAAANGDSVTIMLPHNGVSLSEVVVTPPKLSVSPGRFSFIPGDIIKDVTNAFSVLKYVPLLQVSAISDEISIIGKESCRILINGKEPIMSQDAIIKMLRASEPGRVKKIEVWLQPGIYRQDEGAIINIVLAPSHALMGSADLQLSYQERLSARQMGMVNIEYGKWQFSAQLSVNESQDDTETLLEYTRYDNTGITTEGNASQGYLWQKKQTYKSSSSTIAIVPSIGASVDLGHNNSLGLSIMSWMRNENTTNKTHTITLPSGDNDITTGKITAPITPSWTIGRLNYSQTLDSIGSSLDASAIYTGTLTNSDNTFIPADAMQGYNSRNFANSIQVKGCWTKKFTPRATWELGFDTFYDKVDNKLDRSRDGSLNGSLVTEDDLTQQQYQADLFTAFSYDFSSVFSLNAGVRGRWYQRDMTQRVVNADSRHNDVYILPSASASFSFNPKHMVTLSYFSSVRQPSYHNTNPISYWLFPDYFYTGNPDLKAEMTHAISLYYALIQKITISGNISFTGNLSARATLPMDDGVTYYKPMEVGHSRNSNISLSYSDSFFSHRWNVWGRLTWTQLHIVNDKLDTSIAPPVENDSRWEVFASTSVTIGSDRSWEISADFKFTPETHTTFSNRKSSSTLNLNLSKDFRFGGRLQLGVYNILNQKDSSWYDCDSYSQTSRVTSVKRSFIAQFTYNFGKNFRTRRNPGYSEFLGR